MKHLVTSGCIAVAAGLLAMQTQASPISTAVGYVSVAVLTNSDAVASVPFNQINELTGTVDSVSGGNTINVTGTPYTAGAYNNGLFYVRMTSGVKNGLWSTVTGNTASSITVADAAILTGVVNGDTFTLNPHQTLNTVFPASQSGISYFISSSPALRKTEVLFLNQTSVGINKSPVASYYRLAGGWRLVGPDSTTDQGNTVLPPNTYVIIRNKGTAIAPLTVLPDGVVEFGTVGRSLATSGTQNDLYCVSGRPVPMTLNELELAGTAAFVTSTSPALRKDQILLFNNATSGQNKSPFQTYYYLSQGANIGWRLVGPDSTTEQGNNPIILPGEGFIIRKATGTASTNDWQQTAPYPSSN